MNWKIPLFRIYADEEDRKTVSKVIERGTEWANGPEIAEFEDKLSKYIGRKYVLVFNSGTSAMHSLLLSHDVKGEVIVPSFTFISTATTVLMVGAKPVFADIEEETLGLSYESVKKKITDKTKAVVIVHYAKGVARDTEKIRDLCKEKEILFFEDAAEVLGAELNGVKLGNFSDAAMFSFCQNKIISTGEGGAIVTDSEEIYEKLKLIRSLGRHDKGKDYFSNSGESSYLELGYNFRMPSINAALGISQLKKIDFIVDKRVKNAEFYNKNLKGIDKITTLHSPKNSKNVYQLYTILLDSEKTRDKLQAYLDKKGIMSKVYFKPAHLTEFFKNYESLDLEVTEEVGKRVLSLPIFVDMKKEEIKLIIKSIKECFGGYQNERII